MKNETLETLWRGDKPTPPAWSFQFLWTQLRSRAWPLDTRYRLRKIQVWRFHETCHVEWRFIHFNRYFLYPPLTWQYRYLSAKHLRTPAKSLFIAPTCRRMIFPLKFPSITDIFRSFLSIALSRPSPRFWHAKIRNARRVALYYSTIETVTLEWRLKWLLLHGDRKNCRVPLHSTSSSVV